MDCKTKIKFTPIKSKPAHIPCVVCRHPWRNTEPFNLSPHPDTVTYLCHFCKSTVYQIVLELASVASRVAPNWKEF
jgi:hypothetical protein